MIIFRIGGILKGVLAAWTIKACVCIHDSPKEKVTKTWVSEGWSKDKCNYSPYFSSSGLLITLSTIIWKFMQCAKIYVSIYCLEVSLCFSGCFTSDFSLQLLLVLQKYQRLTTIPGLWLFLCWNNVYHIIWMCVLATVSAHYDDALWISILSTWFLDDKL